jgi:glycosyltransferase involved in cell wall biosynthesis
VKPQIVFFTDSFFFSGSQNMIANFIENKSINQDYDISLIYNYSIKYEIGLANRVGLSSIRVIPVNLLQKLNYSEEQKNKTRAILNKVIFIPHRLFSIIYNTIILYRLFSKQHIDLLHVNNSGYPAAVSCYSAVFAAKLSKIKNIVYVVNNIPVGYKIKSRWIDFLFDKLVSRYVSCFVTGSKYANKKLKKILKLEDNKLHAIPNGISPRKTSIDKDTFYRNHGININSQLFAVIANLEKRKGHIYLLEAIKSLVKDKTLTIPIFFFEGTGPEEENINKFIDENQLSDYIVKASHINNIFDLLNASTAIILPSIEDEDFPNIISESMCLGKPVIATNISGIPEQIINNETGLLIPPKNACAIGNAIKQLVLDEEKRIEMGKKARIRFLENFHSDIVVIQYKCLYNNLINKNNNK